MTGNCDNMGYIILDLCGGSGSWSRPFAMAGYDVRLITLPTHDVLNYSPPDNVFGVLAAPPCTEFSVLNCRAEARERSPEDGLKIVKACVRIIETYNPTWWALENPVGHLRGYIGPPKLTFQPWEYGDPWTKRTDIWGSFNIPEKLFERWADVPNKLPLYKRPGREKPGFAYLHKSARELIPQLLFANPKTDADFRAITPPGFAAAFFEANKAEKWE